MSHTGTPTGENKAGLAATSDRNGFPHISRVGQATPTSQTKFEKDEGRDPIQTSTPDPLLTKWPTGGNDQWWDQAKIMRKL